nr:MAG TPA: hypothetical protein [Caudoviricetes sp.]
MARGGEALRGRLERGEGRVRALRGRVSPVDGTAPRYLGAGTGA